MQFRRMQRVAQIMFVSGVSIAALGAGAGIGHAYGASGALIVAQTTLPQSPEAPVSPTNPSAFPGMTAPNTGTTINPLTGTPCLGAGSSAIGGTQTMPGATPPATDGVYGQSGTSPGAC
jgi:hypothetical protein